MLSACWSSRRSAQAPRLALRWSRPDLAAGEAWRLVTGHLVHLDLEHALLNVAGLLLVWALFSRVFTAGQWALTLLAGVVAIDLGLWVVNVELQWYVGASGLLHTAMAAGIVRQMLARDPAGLGPRRARGGEAALRALQRRDAVHGLGGAGGDRCAPLRSGGRDDLRGDAAARPCGLAADDPRCGPLNP